MAFPFLRPDLALLHLNAGGNAYLNGAFPSLPGPTGFFPRLPAEMASLPALPVPPRAGEDDGVVDSPEAVLDDKALWEQFSECGTEMVITKSGRLVSLRTPLILTPP